MGKKQLADLIDACYRQGGQKKTVLLADKLRTLGYKYATMAGISICIDDMKIPDAKHRELSAATKEVRRSRSSTPKVSSPTASATTRSSTSGPRSPSDRQGDDGRDRLRRSSRTRTRAKSARSPSFNPIFIMADSGARGSTAADPAAGRHARPHGQAVGRNHRDADHHELPRRPLGSPVLHLDPRRP